MYVYRAGTTTTTIFYIFIYIKKTEKKEEIKGDLY